jgi:DNA-binding NtrC family response regulator
MAGIRILVVDDDDLLRSIIVERLSRQGYEVVQAATLMQARSALTRELPDLALLDVKLPDGEGTELLRLIHSEGDVPCVMMTAHATVANAVAALKDGASDYLEKPFSLDRLDATITAALELTALRREVHALRQRFGAGRVIGNSAPMQDLLSMIERISPADSTTVLIEGETGTGKGVMARLIHELSPRARGPFISVTCSALAETLMESEVFGHEKGAFTDARALKRGLVELADKGTLFLDEIGELSLRLQSKLLEFIEEKSFRRVGGTRDLHVDARVIAATNRELDRETAEGRFRADLYYRLRVVPLRLPPLRERPDDIPALSKAFLLAFNQEFGRHVRRVEPAALTLLERYRWPGNVRELRNVLERAVLLTEGSELQASSLPPEVRGVANGAATAVELGALGVDLEQIELTLLREALRRARGSRTEAGRLLGLSRHQIRNRLKKYGALL